MNTAEFLKKLEPDFSNIDEVYNELLKEYNPDNIERSELMFINSFDFDKIDDDDVNATKLSHYLGKKVSKIDWQNIDFYNRYLETKEFNIGYFSFLANKGKKDFKETNLEFNRTFERFEFIYNRIEKIDKLELKSIFLETLNFHKTNIQKLRFKPLIENLIQRVESIETAAENNKPDEPKELLCNLITHPKKVKIADAIKQKYNGYKGKDFKILYEALLELDLFPKKGKRMTFFRCLQNEGYNIKSSQMLENQYFNKGSFDPRKENVYLKTDDEIQFDTIVKYLKTII